MTEKTDTPRHDDYLDEVINKLSPPSDSSSSEDIHFEFDESSLGLELGTVDGGEQSSTDVFSSGQTFTEQDASLTLSMLDGIDLNLPTIIDPDHLVVNDERSPALNVMEISSEPEQPKQPKQPEHADMLVSESDVFGDLGEISLDFLNVTQVNQGELDEGSVDDFIPDSSDMLVPSGLDVDLPIDGDLFFPQVDGLVDQSDDANQPKNSGTEAGVAEPTVAKDENDWFLGIEDAAGQMPSVTESKVELIVAPDPVVGVDVPAVGELFQSGALSGQPNQDDDKPLDDWSGDNFDIDKLSLNDTSLLSAPENIDRHDADIYAQSLATAEEQITSKNQSVDAGTQDKQLDSSSFLREKGDLSRAGIHKDVDSERKEPTLESLTSDTTKLKDESDLNSPPQRVIVETQSRLPVFFLSVAGVVLLSIVGGGFFLSHSMIQSQKLQIDKMSAELSGLKGHLSTLEDITKSGDGTTLLSAYETMKGNVSALSEEQKRFVTALSTQEQLSKGFETQMIDRLQKVVDFAQYSNEKLESTEQSIRAGVSQTIAAELKAHVPVDPRIDALNRKVEESAAKMKQLESAIRSQSEIIGLMENEQQFLKKQTGTQSVRQSTASGMTTNVSVKANAPQSVSAQSFSDQMSSHVVLGVLQNENGSFEIFLQPVSAVNTSEYEIYLFKSGSKVEIPGYGRIIDVQAVDSPGYVVPYQVVTERGVLRGRKS